MQKSRSSARRSVKTGPTWKVGLALLILLLLIGLVSLMAYLGSYNTNSIALVSEAAGFPGGRRIDYVPPTEVPRTVRNTPLPTPEGCPPPPCSDSADVSCVQGYDPTWCLGSPRPSAMPFTPPPSPRSSASPFPQPVSPDSSGMPTPQGGGETLAPVTTKLLITDETLTHYCAKVLLTNNSSKLISSWFVNLQLNQSQLVSQVGARFTQIFNRYFVSPFQENSKVDPMSTNTSVSFCAEKTGINWLPSNLRVNYRFER